MTHYAPYGTGCTQVCNQGRDCTCAPQACRTAATDRKRNKTAPVVVDSDRERAAQDDWLALVHRSGAGAGVHTDDAGQPEPLPTDWGVVIILAAAVLVFVGAMFFLWMGLPVAVVAGSVAVAIGLEIIGEVLG
ncbi:MAG: hypothetical protein K9K35_10455 [Rhodoferax sp.]|nr:hypothetical protein [Rhodoferax sp.]